MSGIRDKPFLKPSSQRQSPLGGGGTPLGTGHVRTRSDHMMSIDRDREAWQLKHQAMKDQLSSLQDECRKLQVTAQSSKGWSDTSSSVSLPAYYPPPSTTRQRPLIADTTINNSFTRKHYYTSTPRVHRTTPTNHTYLSPESATSSSTRVSPDYRRVSPDHNVDLQRATTRIKQLEKEVSLLEGQLADKTRSARGHVEELTGLRVELAKERASLDILKQEIKDNAQAEIERQKRSHDKQCREYANQLESLRRSKDSLERELFTTRKSLKASQSEVTAHTQRITSLHSTLDQQRHSHNEALTTVRSEVKSGYDKINKLEQALEVCGQELQGHVTSVETVTTQHKLDNDQLQSEVDRLTSELVECRSSLLEKTELAIQLQIELNSNHTHEGKLLSQYETNTQSLVVNVQELKDSITKIQAELSISKDNEIQLQKQLSENMVTITQLEQSQLLLKGQRSYAENDVNRLNSELAEYRRGFQEKAGLREQQVEEMLTHMQGELAKRSQQVLDMDGLLRSHQADTASKRLQLERSLATRQADLRVRNNELESAVIQLSQCKSREEGLRVELHTLKDHLSSHGHSSDQEKQSRREIEGLVKKVDLLTKNNSHLKEQHKIQTRTQEELSRYRAQVISLSAELAAERTISEEGRREIAQIRLSLQSHDIL